MSEPQRPQPPADDEPFRIFLDDGRLFIDRREVTIDVPLAHVESYEMGETPDPEVFDLRVCLRLRVSEVVLRHRANPSGIDAIGRAWRAARGESLPDAEPTPVAETKPAIEPMSPIGGPPLLEDSPDWLIFAPLPDTQLLSVAQLLVQDEPPAT